MVRKPLYNIKLLVNGIDTWDIERKDLGHNKVDRYESTAYLMAPAWRHDNRPSSPQRPK
jgi:hypothetical protein